MSFVNTSSDSVNGSFNKGEPLYITLLTLVAALGGLLFGYDLEFLEKLKNKIECYY
jgi:hypothetical protein